MKNKKDAKVKLEKLEVKSKVVNPNKKEDGMNGGWTYV